MELECAVQNYSWGVYGFQSSVAQLAKSVNPDYNVSNDIPFAELWMGTHPNGPSKIKGISKTLCDFINEHPYVLGKQVQKNFGNNLPFLFKILSVNQALSIQAHPNKTHAEHLHKHYPDIYKDPNHKPEMTIALTEFHALCGFRPKEEIAAFLGELPELQAVVGENNFKDFISDPCEDNLKNCFAAFMTASEETVATALQTFVQRINTLDGDKKAALLCNEFLELYKYFSNDIGCFSVYLLNYIILKPGEALFLGPNIIHAYLKGDCTECMACSDNVVRAGLTPKYQDVSTLISMLEYKMTSANDRKFCGEQINEYLKLFNPPVPDFAVEMIKIPAQVEYKFNAVSSASILLVFTGEAEVVISLEDYSDIYPPPDKIKRGSVLFLAAEQNMEIKQGHKELLIFRAFCMN